MHSLFYVSMSEPPAISLAVWLCDRPSGAAAAEEEALLSLEQRSGRAIWAKAFLISHE